MFNTKTCETCGHKFKKDTGVCKDESWFCKEHNPKWDKRKFNYSLFGPSYRYYVLKEVNEDGTDIVKEEIGGVCPLPTSPRTKKSRKREYNSRHCHCGWRGKRLKMHQTLTGHTN